MKKGERKCEGICSRNIGSSCVGVIKLVHVSDNKYPFTDWGNFYYCDTAIQTDLDNNFNVEILNE